jgi:WhiB family redox-sensing transcriptional regulator
MTVYRRHEYSPTVPTNHAPLSLLGIADQPWMGDALCAQVDPEMFFPERGGSIRSAKAICRRCPVSAECLAYALEHHEVFGVWGGVTERERRKLRRKAS